MDDESMKRQVQEEVNRKLDGCIVWNAHNTVLVSKRSAIYVAVELLHNVFF